MEQLGARAWLVDATRQPEEFLRLAATTALAGRFLNLTVRPASSQELEDSRSATLPRLNQSLETGLISDLNGSYEITRYDSTVERGVALLTTQARPCAVRW